MSAAPFDPPPSILSPRPAVSAPAAAHVDAGLPAEVQHVLQNARRAETPCGAGTVVWHLWGEAGADPALPPLVLLHGGSGSWTHWLRNVDVLAASGRRVVVPDLPGSGDSALPVSGGDVDVLPEPLEHGLQCLLGDARVDLVGFSFGGMAAGLLAAQFPARVARLVLVGAPGLGISNAVPLRAWRHQPDAAARDAVHRANLLSLMVSEASAIDETALRLHVSNVERDRLRQRMLSRTDILRRALQQVHCPMWAIYGENDAIYHGTLGDADAALREAPHYRGMQRIARAGHWVPYEQAGAFNVALLGVLGQPVAG